MSELTARDGDILVVSYPEVSIPIGHGSYSAVKVGGLIYTRKLIEGDDCTDQYSRIYSFLKAKADQDGREKIAAYQQELSRVRGMR